MLHIILGLSVGSRSSEMSWAPRSSLVMDPNVSMHEGKAFVCNVEKA